MSHDSVPLPPAESQLSRLVESMCDGTILSDERDQLELLLEKDRNAQLFYIAYLDLHAQVQWMMRGEETAAESDQSETAKEGYLAVVTDEIPHSISSTISSPFSLRQSLPSSVSSLTIPSTALSAISRKACRWPTCLRP